MFKISLPTAYLVCLSVLVREHLYPLSEHWAHLAQATIHLVSRWFSQSVSQLVSQSVSQSVSKSVIVWMEDNKAV